MRLKRSPGRGRRMTFRSSPRCLAGMAAQDPSAAPALAAGRPATALAAPTAGRSPVGSQIGALPRNVGPIGWKDRQELETDLTSLKEALEGLKYEEAFMPSVAVGQIVFMIRSTHYQSESDYLYALADAMKDEYEAIVNAGFILQIDAPDVPMMRNRQLWQVPFEDYQAAPGAPDRGA